MLRICIAFFMVALAFPAVIFLLEPSRHSFFVAMLFGAFTVGVSLFVGLPLVALCLRRGWVKVWHASVVGALAGLGCSAPLFFLFGGFSPYGFVLVLWGALHGVAFGVLAFWRNPYAHRSLGGGST